MKPACWPPCGAFRPARGDDPCKTLPTFEVVYRANGKVIDRTPACFAHGIAEVDRHYAAAGAATADLEEREPGS